MIEITSPDDGNYITHCFDGYNLPSWYCNTKDDLRIVVRQGEQQIVTITIPPLCEGTSVTTTMLPQLPILDGVLADKVRAILRIAIDKGFTITKVVIEPDSVQEL
jgi:hypothetical protein